MVDRPAFSDLAVNLFRDHNTIGNPGSGIFNPHKPDLRTYFGEMEDFFNDLYDKAPSLLGNVGGSANAATAQATPTVDALAAGQSYIYQPTANNTAASPTLNIDALAALVLADADGVDLLPGQMVNGRRYLLTHDGTKLRVPSIRDQMLYKALDADDAGQNVNTAQPMFPTAGGITLPIGAWMFEIFLWLTRSAGGVSHTTSFLHGGSATYTVDWSALVNTGDVATTATPSLTSASVATAVSVKAASTSTTEQIIARIVGHLNVSAAGTWIPQFQYSAAPGGAPSTRRGSWLRLIKRPGLLTSVGTWA